jgi:hypothetical protein
MRQLAMFSEILKIIPRLSQRDLQKMEKALSKRFTRVAKKFGKGLKKAVVGGGLFSFGLAVINKILNPLKEVQESIEKILNKGDNLSTYAGQFGTTSGKLVKLQELAASTGLAPEQFYQILGKFQSALAENKKNPTTFTSVKNYVDEKDTADAFFKFVQSLQKMDKLDQVAIQKQLFGDEALLRLSEFIQTDFAKQLKIIGAKDASAYTNSLEKLGSLQNLDEALTSKRNLRDIEKKAKLMNEDMIYKRDASEQLALDRENARLKSYKDLQELGDATDKILILVEKATLMLSKLAGEFNKGVVILSRIAERILGSRFIRGMMGGE